ncbi:Glutamine transport ATP-binding protein GlnQ [compost metagenome]
MLSIIQAVQEIRAQMAKLDKEGTAQMVKSGELLLEVKGVNKFFGDRQVLNGIDLQVERGEVIVVLGPSGCGKSTLLRCLNGLEPVQGGNILYREQNLAGADVN